MRQTASIRILESLGHWEKLEALSSRFGWPFIPEYELEFFRKLHHAELKEALAATEDEFKIGENAQAYAARGRIRRILGDISGSAQDLKRALDLKPDYAAAHAWLGELDLTHCEAEMSLSRAIELDAELGWAYLYRGACRLLKGDARGARVDLERLTLLKPESGLGRLLLGAAEERLGCRRAAAKVYKAAARDNPVCSAAYLLWSRVEPRRRRALRACEGALNADPTYALIALSTYKPGSSWDSFLMGLRRFAFAEPERAGWYYRQEDIHYSPYQLQEYEDSSRLLRMLPNASWPAALVGRGALRCPPNPARLRQGLLALERAVRGSKRIGWARAWRALAWIKARQPQRALLDFNTCLRLQPLYHRAYAWRGALLRNLGRAGQALADLDRAVAIDEQYPFAIHERSLARRALGNFVGAALDLDWAFRLDFRYSWVFAVGREPSPAEMSQGLSELDSAAAAHPHVASLLVWRGQLRLQRREFSEAFIDFSEATHRDPHHALGHAWHGHGLVESGQPGAGRERLIRAVELEPSTWIFQGWLAEAEFRAGRHGRALDILGRILKAKPKTWWVLHQRALFHLCMGCPRKALRDIEEAVGSEGRHAEGYYLLAQARLELADFPGALKAVEKALVVSPNLGRAYLLRAQILEKQGRHDGVLKDYRTVYERFPYLFNQEQKELVAGLLR